MEGGTGIPPISDNDLDFLFSLVDQVDDFEQAASQKPGASVAL